jgi:hypothetical protein
MSNISNKPVIDNLHRTRLFTDKDTHTVLDPFRGAKPSDNTLDTIKYVNTMVMMGKSWQEICDATGLSSATVRRRYYGFVEEHNVRPRVSIERLPEYDGTRARDAGKGLYADVYYDNGYKYVYGYKRIHIGACCNI